MYEYEIKNLKTNDHWLGYADSMKQLKAKHPEIDWEENVIIGKWYVY